MLSINTNLSSLIVQSSLLNSTLGLNQAIERMTTGFKINGAKDNAAGYSIAEKMVSKISSYDVALDNTQMGLDLIETAASSLDLITNHLQRIRDLAEQAANGTYGADSLKAIQSEVDARTAEIERVIENTEYNGIQLFKIEPPQGSATGTFIQEVTPLTEAEALAQGYTLIKTAEDLDKIRNNLSGKYILMNDIDLSGIDWEPIGDQVYSSGHYIGGFEGEFNGNGYVIKNLTTTVPSSKLQGLFGYIENGKVSNLGLEDVYVSSTTGAGAIVGFGCQAEIINCYSTGMVISDRAAGGLAGFADYTTISNCYSDARLNAYYAGGLLGALDTGDTHISNSYSTGDINGNYAGGLVGNVWCDISNSYATGSITSNTLSGGLIGSCPSGTPTATTATNCYFNTETTGQTVGDGSGQVTNIQGVTTAELNQLIANGMLPQASLPNSTHSGITLQVGIDSSDNSRISFETGVTINLNINVSTSNNARNSLDEIDSVLDMISVKQTEFGAVQNRLESATETITVQQENLVSSLSTIRDADIAEESSQYIKMQILQQASATLLATANQTPAIALQLI